MDVGDGLAEGVGDLGEVEAGFALGREEDDLGEERGVGRDGVTPGVGGLVVGGVGGAFEREIVGEGRIHLREWRRDGVCVLKEKPVKPPAAANVS